MQIFISQWNNLVDLEKEIIIIGKYICATALEDEYYRFCRLSTPVYASGKKWVAISVKARLDGLTLALFVSGTQLTHQIWENRALKNQSVCRKKVSRHFRSVFAKIFAKDGSSQVQNNFNRTLQKRCFQGANIDPGLFSPCEGGKSILKISNFARERQWTKKCVKMSEPREYYWKHYKIHISWSIEAREKLYILN